MRKIFASISTSILYSLVFLAIVSCTSIERPSSSIPFTTNGNATSVDYYRIGVGDVLKVIVRKSPDLTVEGPVRPDGRISIPLIGDVLAVGKTTDELAKTVESSLDRYLRVTEVTVIITDPVSAEFLGRVRITGSVVTPLSVPYKQGMTILDLVLMAGGLTEYAIGNRAILHRVEKNGTKAYAVRLNDILKKGRIESNFRLMPSDIITVPDRSF